MEIIMNATLQDWVRTQHVQVIAKCFVITINQGY